MNTPLDQIATEDYDVVIVGGGMVGSASGIGLAHLGLRVAILESRPPEAFDQNQEPDLRVSAINLASHALLSSIGAWPYIESMRVHPYQRLAVWEENERCEFKASEIGLAELGYFVENRVIQLGLHECARQLSNLDLLTNASLDSLSFDQNAHILLDDGRALSAQWVVAADGVQSSMRSKLNIKTQGWPYSQEVLAITVKAEHTANDITWQQFSPSGPMAFLPLYDNYAELIWYNKAEKIRELKTLSNEALQKAVIDAFPKQLGDIHVLNKASFPIQRAHALSYSKEKLVLLGDAAHSINPLAGQGVNLGFKDVAALLNLIEKNGVPKNDSAIRSLFKKYECQRRPDNELMMSSMDALYFGFSNNIPPIKALRNLGLGFATKVPFAKKQILKYAAGVK
jgi:2-octaprenyl-3-methyl-6-methoxy-1,4-benzoquinol hydroxylase